MVIWRDYYLDNNYLNLYESRLNGGKNGLRIMFLTNEFKKGFKKDRIQNKVAKVQ